MQEHYDFLAAHGSTQVVLGSGQRVRQTGPLPRDAGVHLVAGKARRGGFRTAATVPEGPTAVSPDGRWLGVCRDDAWALYDLHHACAPGFRFQPGGGGEVALHPSGEVIARRTAERVELWLPDGKLLKAAAVPRRHSKKDYHGYDSLTFSASGEHLWLAHAPPEGDDGLWLLGVPALDVLDRIPQPRNPVNHYDVGERHARWPEFAITLNPATDHLAVRRWAGDTFLSLTFHAARRGKIATHPHYVGVDDPLFNGDPIGQPAFAPSGKRFCGWDSYACIYEWTWPGCAVEHQTHVSVFNLHEDDACHPEAMAYWKDHILVQVEEWGAGARTTYEVQILQSGSLEPRQTVRPFVSGRLLPNAMLLRPREGKMDVMEFGLRPGRVSVVLEMDSERGCCRRVLHRRGTSWHDITDDVAWIEPNFSFAAEW